MPKTREDFLDEVYDERRAKGSNFDGAIEEGDQRWVNDILCEVELRKLALEMVETCYKTMAAFDSPRPIPSADWFLAQLKKAQELKDED